MHILAPAHHILKAEKCGELGSLFAKKMRRADTMDTHFPKVRLGLPIIQVSADTLYYAGSIAPYLVFNTQYGVHGVHQVRISYIKKAL